MIGWLRKVFARRVPPSEIVAAEERKAVVIGNARVAVSKGMQAAQKVLHPELDSYRRARYPR